MGRFFSWNSIINNYTKTNLKIVIKYVIRSLFYLKNIEIMATTTQIAFTTNADLKRKTMQKLKQEGLTLKVLLQYAMQAYVQGKIWLWITTNPDYPVWNTDLEEEYNEKMQDFQNNKNVVDGDDMLTKYHNV